MVMNTDRGLGSALMLSYVTNAFKPNCGGIDFVNVYNTLHTYIQCIHSHSHIIMEHGSAT